jgi:hypothetical protein
MPEETHPAAKALTSFAAKMRDMADAMEKADQMIYERLILGIPAEPPVWTIVTVDDELFLRARMGDWFIIGDGAPGPVSRSWAVVCALGAPEVLEPESVKALRAELLVLREQVAKKAPEHDEDCEAEYEAGAHAWTPCGCWASRAEAEGLVARAEKAEREVAEFIAIDEGAPVISANFSDFAGNPIPATITVTRSGAEDERAEPAPVEVTEEPADLSLAVRGSGGTVWEQRRSRHMPDLFFWYDGQRAHDAGDGRSWSYLLAHHGPLTLVETGAKS